MSAAIIAAGVGSAAGGAFSDAFGRKRALLLADVLFTLGALGMGAAWSAGVLIAGKLLGLLPGFALCRCQGGMLCLLLAAPCMAWHAGGMLAGQGARAGARRATGGDACLPACMHVFRLRWFSPAL